MTQTEVLNVDDFLALLKTRQNRLPFELGAFVALEACETVIRSPRVVEAKDVEVLLDGSIRLAGGSQASEEHACESIRTVLAKLLLASGSGVPEVLLRLVERGPSDGSWGLARMRDELEACLVPLNRSAARRVLSRLFRDVLRSGASADASAKDRFSAKLLDEQVEMLLRGELSMPDEPDSRVLTMPKAPLRVDAAHEPFGEASAGVEDRPHESLQPTNPPPSPAYPDVDDLEYEGDRSGGGALSLIAVFFVVLLASLAAGLAMLRPDLMEHAWSQVKTVFE